MMQWRNKISGLLLCAALLASACSGSDSGATSSTLIDDVANSNAASDAGGSEAIATPTQPPASESGATDSDTADGPGAPTFDAPELAPTATLDLSQINVDAFSLSPDGSRIAALTLELNLEIYDVASGAQLASRPMDQAGELFWLEADTLTILGRSWMMTLNSNDLAAPVDVTPFEGPTCNTSNLVQVRADLNSIVVGTNSNGDQLVCRLDMPARQWTVRTLEDGQVVQAIAAGDDAIYAGIGSDAGRQLLTLDPTTLAIVASEPIDRDGELVSASTSSILRQRNFMPVIEPGDVALATTARMIRTDPTGRYYYSIGSDMQLWDAASGVPVGVVSDVFAQPSVAQWNASGTAFGIRDTSTQQIMVFSVG